MNLRGIIICIWSFGQLLTLMTAIGLLIEATGELLRVLLEQRRRRRDRLAAVTHPPSQFPRAWARRMRR